MRVVVALLLVVVTAACAAKEEATPDSAAPAVAAAAPTLADFAGMWSIASVLEGTPDTVRSSITQSADGTCTLTLADRPPISCTASISGDSLVIQTSEYESILRKGVMTSVRTAGVMSGGMLTGVLVSTYKAAGGDQVVHGTYTGTKAP